MTLAQTLKCEKRVVSNTGHLRELKRQDWIPGVIYGKGQETVPIMMAGKELEKTFSRHGYRALYSIQMNGQNKPVLALVRELQKHPISGKLIHVDFLQVQADVKINNEVSVQLLGEEEIINKGYILQEVERNVEISCFPGDIPESLQIDISNLTIGDKVTAKNLKLPPNVELLSDSELVLATILPPDRAASEETEAELKEDVPAPEKEEE